MKSKPIKVLHMGHSRELEALAKVTQEAMKQQEEHTIVLETNSKGGTADSTSLHKVLKEQSTLPRFDSTPTDDLVLEVDPESVTTISSGEPVKEKSEVFKKGWNKPYPPDKKGRRNQRRFK